MCESENGSKLVLSPSAKSDSFGEVRARILPNDMCSNRSVSGISTSVKEKGNTVKEFVSHLRGQVPRVSANPTPLFKNKKFDSDQVSKASQEKEFHKVIAKAKNGGFGERMMPKGRWGLRGKIPGNARGLRAQEALFKSNSKDVSRDRIKGVGFKSFQGVNEFLQVSRLKKNDSGQGKFVKNPAALFYLNVEDMKREAKSTNRIKTKVSQRSPRRYSSPKLELDKMKSLKLQHLPTPNFLDFVGKRSNNWPEL